MEDSMLWLGRCPLSRVAFITRGTSAPLHQFKTEFRLHAEGLNNTARLVPIFCLLQFLAKSHGASSLLLHDPDVPLLFNEKSRSSQFFSESILSKKGSLARIWLAAHWERKLSKTQFLQTSIEQSVGAIVRNDQPLALRLSGQLLLGVVKIYSRKARYLLEDCNEALLRIKLVVISRHTDEASWLGTGSDHVPLTLFRPLGQVLWIFQTTKLQQHTRPLHCPT